MLSRLPHEVRLQIFHYVFAQSGSREVIRVKNTAEGITYDCTSRYDEVNYAGAISLLDATIFGNGVAVSVAEALYQSSIVYAVDATCLCAFLRSCPFSLLVEPGKYIETIRLYMDEDPGFDGDGKDGQALRKADWVDLESDIDEQTTTDPDNRTQLMRRCWRAVLEMPKLKKFEFWIMPSRGKAPADDIQRWEIRDIIPTHFRLSLNDVDVAIYLRTWEIHQGPTHVAEGWLDQKRDCTVDENGMCESQMDLSTCIPYNWNEIMDQERSGIPPEHYEHAIRNCVAVQDLIDRLKSDEDYEVTSEGDIRLKRKRGDDAEVIKTTS